jgi:mRNA interferase MazF
MTTTDPSPQRGEIWKIRFDPTKGSEIGKTRPAVVVSIPAVGRLPLRIVVPISGWKPQWASSPWLVYLAPSKRNGLTKESAADAFQVKSVSLERFVERTGSADADTLEEVAAAVALCVGL